MVASKIEDAYPLTPVQQGLLFHSLYAPDSGVYVTQMSCELSDVDPDAFEKAWQRVVQRHSILRTAFVWKKTEEPLQVVGREVKLPVRREDWRDLGPDQRRTALDEFLERDRRRGFEPARAPLMRLALFRLAENRFHLVWSHHHLLLDGWSVPILLREVLTFYREHVGQGPAALGEPRPYSDYVDWLERQDREAAEAYWRAALAGHEGRSEPPFLRPADAASDGVPGPTKELSSTLTRRESSRVRELARRARVTLNTIVRALWALYAGRCAGTSDVVFGVTTSGRPETLDGADGMLGLFINTLPVRLRVPESLSLLEWLPELQQDQAEMEAHGHLPLVQIQKLAERTADTPLFETLLVFENYPTGESGGEPREEPVAGISAFRTFEATNYPFNLLVAPGDEITLRFQLDSHRVETTAASRALHHLKNLVLSMAEEPESVPGDLSFLAPAERHQLLWEWNDGPRPVVERSFVERLAATVSSVPDRVAAVFGGSSVSYGELARRAWRAASVLSSQGVSPGDLVVLLAERGLGLLVSILGTFEAGAAYLPLDPQHPPGKLAQVLAASRARFVVVGPEHGARLEESLASSDFERPRVLGIEELIDGRPSAGEESGAPEARPGLGELAYVIFTSGSTGVPKGVMVEHLGMVNHLEAKIHDLALGADDVVAQTASQTFDISVWQHLAALVVGGRVVILPPPVAMDPVRLAAESARHRVTVLEVVPSLLRVLVEIPAEGPAGSASGDWGLRGLRWMIPTGEALPPSLCREWLAGSPEVPLLNAYGPTECSDDVSHQVVAEAPGAEAASVPIGRAVANTHLVVVDRRLLPVPLGVGGELLVGGLGVGRGYLGSPRRTAESFVPDPFSEVAGARAYRTGDLARVLTDGTVDFLGRLDHQVKIRGFRIELGEVEVALSSVAGVREVVAVARELGADKQLVAYYAAEPDAGVAVEELRAAAAARLPEYMVPAVFVELDRLPLTANGKIDRRALPEPSGSREDGARTVTPRTPVEEALAEVWREVLRIDHVGVLDNFFELGGDSILSLQVVARSNRRGIHLTPRHLFEHPTIAALAVVAEDGPTISAEQGPVTGALPLTPIQSRFFEDQPEAPHHYNQSMLFELTADLKPAALARTVQTLERHHDALRLRFQHDRRGGWQQVCAAPAHRAPFFQVDLSEVEDGRLSTTVEEIAGQLQRSLDLARGPIFRVVLFDAGRARPARLMILVHHLAVDGVSWRLLLEELEAAYEAFSAGREPALPPKTTSFRAWAHRLREHAAGPALAAELERWTDPRRTRVAPVPLDRFEGPNTQGSSETVTAALTAEETEALLREVPATYGTQINDTLIAGLALALAEWVGESTLMVDLEGHGREELFEDVDLSRTVGWFTSLFPVLLRIEGAEDDPGEALRAVKEQLRAVPGRGIGYGILRHLHPDPAVRAGLAAQPAPEVAFNYLGQMDPAGERRDWIRAAGESTGPDVHPEGRRSHLLLVSGQVVGGRLFVSITFSRNRHRRETVETLVDSYLARLRSIIEHCRGAELGGPTPSDFPDAELTQGELDDLLTELSS